jgi:hypothetical protein
LAVIIPVVGDLNLSKLGVLLRTVELLGSVRHGIKLISVASLGDDVHSFLVQLRLDSLILGIEDRLLLGFRGELIFDIGRDASGRTLDNVDTLQLVFLGQRFANANLAVHRLNLSKFLARHGDGNVVALEAALEDPISLVSKARVLSVAPSVERILTVVVPIVGDLLLSKGLARSLQVLLGLQQVRRDDSLLAVLSPLLADHRITHDAGSTVTLGGVFNPGGLVAKARVVGVAPRVERVEAVVVPVVRDVDLGLSLQQERRDNSLLTPLLYLSPYDFVVKDVLLLVTSGHVLHPRGLIGVARPVSLLPGVPALIAVIVPVVWDLFVELNGINEVFDRKNSE